MSSVHQFKIFCLSFITLILISCESKVQNNNLKDSHNSTVKISQQESVKLVNDNDDFNDKFKVVLIDSTNKMIQRVFVVIDSNNISVIRTAICKICKKYNLTNKSNISFFTEEKYANYKDKLFNIDDKFFPKEEYEKWLNNYYLAEYESISEELTLFPTGNREKLKINIVPCEEC